MKMSIKGSLTKELSESVTTLLGHSVKISLKCLVKMEIKADKTENKILAFTACRLFILSAKVPTKIEMTFHYLDINSIESKRKNQLTIGVNTENKSYTFYSVDSNNGEEINLMIIQLGTALKTLFPQIPLESFIRKIEVEPISRLQAMIDYNHTVEERARINSIETPCGGFSTQYACLCDYFCTPYREEVAWDVDTIYCTHNNTELSLLDFEHLDTKELVPIIAALSYNGWFTKFRASNVKIFTASSHASNDVAEQIINLLKRSTVLEEIYLDNTGLRADFVNKLFLALLSNSQSSLHVIDLSNNTIEDKGLKSLCGFVAKASLGTGLSDDNNHISTKLYKGLIHLNLSHNGLTAKGISDLSDALSLNKTMSSTLTYLNLSENILKDDVNKLYNFLAQPNNLIHLDLSATECCLDTAFGALLRGCTQKLTHLNLSRNQFSSKKSHKDVNVPPSFKTFFSSALALKTLNLSLNKLPSEALKAMLLGFACNELATDVRINLSSNDLKSSGATVLEFALCGIRCISGLDLSDNGFDSDVSNVINAISKNKSIKYLSIGKNFNNIKLKHMSRVLESLVQLLQDEDSVLESLSIVDSKLRNDTCLVINALGSNQSLVNIDVTGNQMGLSGARTLAKAIQVNTKLETIYMDRNLIPTSGFIDIAYSLERNYSLKYMPVPVQDVQLAMIKLPERTEAAITKIQELVRRNNLPQSLLRNTRLYGHHMPIDASVFHVIDKLTFNLQEIITNASMTENRKVNETFEMKEDDLIKAEQYLKDATNAKHLISRLTKQFIYPEISSETGRRFSTFHVCKPIEANLVEFAYELKNTFEAHVNNVITSMIECVQEQCPHIISDSDKLQSELQRVFNNATTSPLLPSLNYFQTCLTDNIGAHITAKFEEMLHGIVTQICDKVLTEVSECLSFVQRALTGQEQKLGSSQRSSTPDVLRSRTWIETSNSRDSSTEANLSLDENIDERESTIATPKQQTQKRQSLYVRRLRPQSVLDGLTADDIPDLLPKPESSNSGSIDSSLLASTSSDKLEHLGKSRPKKPKTRAPTRANVTSSAHNAKIEKISPKVIEATSNESEKLDEGLDSFFKKSAEIAQKPYVQPKGIFKRFGVKSDHHSNTKHTSEDIKKKGIAEESSNSITSQTSLIYSDEVTRSRSSPNLGNKKHTVSIVARNISPGAEEISNIFESIEKVTSPVTTERADLLAEMKAKQRSKATTPTPLITANTAPVIETDISNNNNNNNNNNISNSSQLQGVKLRATVFGDVMKSPNKLHNTGNEDSILQNESIRSSFPRQSAPPILKQRPKSVVGLLGAKFELSSTQREVNIDSNDINEISLSSDKNDELSQVKKSSAVFIKPRTFSNSSSSSLPK